MSGRTGEYADETSWSINSVWAFLSEHSRITVFGCRKDGETLVMLLKKEDFKGILVSDDAAVYQGLILTHEIARLMGNIELFTFVIHTEADGTNNISERQLRDAAQDRRTGQTNKTERGARRGTVITNVLDSLRGFMPKFTLATAMEELDRRQQTGISCFRRLVRKLKLPPLDLPDKIHSPLELLVPLNNTE